MNRNKNVDALCYYVLNKIDFNVLKSLSSEQLSSIQDAIYACQLRTKHAVDIRGTINLFFMRFYYALIVGRDRRIFVEEIEEDRREKVTLLGNLVYFMVVFPGIILGILLFVIIGLYSLKNMFGIDLLPGEHMGRILGL